MKRRIEEEEEKMRNVQDKELPAEEGWPFLDSAQVAKLCERTVFI